MFDDPICSSQARFEGEPAAVTAQYHSALAVKRESFRESLHQLARCSGLFVSVDEGESANDCDRPIAITVQWSRPGAESFTLHAVTEFEDFEAYEVAQTVVLRMREVEERHDGLSTES